MAKKRRKPTTFIIIVVIFIIALLTMERSTGYISKKFASPVNLNADQASVYFSPDGGCEIAIVYAINSANKTVDVALYSFTSRPIAQALTEAKQRGVSIRVLLDDGQNKSRYSKKIFLINNSIPLRTDFSGALMHHKFAVIDSNLLITGSYNWTASANNKNFENLLIINSTELSNTYLKEFQRLWRHFRS